MLLQTSQKCPKAIFISAFDSSPLAIDYDYSLQNDAENFQKGIDALSKLSSCKIYLTLSSDTPSTSFFNNINGVEINKIDGKHPSGNVGTQIHHISPINKGEIVWTVSPQDVAIIGKYFSTGIYNAQKIIALTGSEVKKPHYCRVIGSCNLSDIISGNYSKDNDVRIISGNALTGIAKKSTGYLGFYHNQITILPEGNNYKFFLTTGWLSPGFGSFSNSRLYPSFLTPNKKYRLDTNTNGEERAFVVTGEMEKVFPFDILPMHLVKAAITKDIDGMENLGIYEVTREDFALCEFVCTSKINIRKIIS
jgi:Na+-transporting NADH:ubiquinone oxidoreductase, subunit NqrA